jgi:hypothetical protein
LPAEALNFTYLTLLRGPGGHDIDRAAIGILTVEGTLGAAEDLDTFQVEQVETHTPSAPDIDLVQEHTDRLVTGRRVGAVADAANIETGFAGVELVE